MKRMLVLVLALLWSTAPAIAQKQTFTGAWNWMWPDASIREIYPNIRSLASDGNGNIFASIVVDDTIQPNGLYISNDSGSTFHITKGMSNFSTMDVVWAVCVIDSNDVLAGMDQVMLKSTDSGNTWNPVMSIPSERFMSFVYLGHDTVLAGGYFGIYRSTDNGNTWANVDTNAAFSPDRKFCYAQSLVATSSGEIFAGTGSGLGTYSYGILRSTDRGNTWEYANNGITNTVPDTTDWNANIISMASVGDTVFAASTHLYRSTDNGQSWQAIADSLFYNNESGAIFASEKGLIVPTLYSLYLTTDAGSTWNDLVNFQLPINVWSAAQGPNDSTVYMGMWNGLGKLTIDDPITAVVTPPSVPRNFSLSQNYPNPFNPTTTIEYSLPQRTNVNLTVYNVLGQIVTTLANGMEGPGQHQVIFDGSRFASGTYLYVLQTDQTRIVKKMMLVK